MKLIGSIIALTLAQCMLSEATPVYVISRLLTRQTPNGIDQCQTPCSPIINFVGSGQESCTPQACCNAAFEQDYLDCFTCTGKAQNETDYSSYQSQLDQLTALCDAAGISVPKLTFPGQNPNRPLSSVSSGTLPASTTHTTITDSLGGSTTSTMQSTAITNLPTTKASNTGKKNVGNTVSQLGLLVISCIMMQGFL